MSRIGYYAIAREKLLRLFGSQEDFSRYNDDLDEYLGRALEESPPLYVRNNGEPVYYLPLAPGSGFHLKLSKPIDPQGAGFAWLIEDVVRVEKSPASQGEFERQFASQVLPLLQSEKR